MTLNERDEQQRLAFLAALREDPHCAATRMAYTDWLLERGFDDDAAAQRAWTPQRHEEALTWMVTHSKVLGDYDSVDKLLAAGVKILKGHGGDELLYPFYLADYWRHFVVLVGLPVPDDLRSTAEVLEHERNMEACGCGDDPCSRSCGAYDDYEERFDND